MSVTALSRVVTGWDLRTTARARQHAPMKFNMRDAGARRAPPIWRRLAQVLAMAALLAGCGTLQRALPSASPLRAPPPPRTATRPPPRLLPPSLLPPSLPQPSLPQPSPAEAPPAPAPARANPAPIDLARLPAALVEALLGPPAGRSANGTGERWTYRAPGCALDLFLFPPVGGGGLTVLDRRASGTDEQECLRRLRADGA